MCLPHKKLKFLLKIISTSRTYYDDRLLSMFEVPDIPRTIREIIEKTSRHLITSHRPTVITCFLPT